MMYSFFGNHLEEGEEGTGAEKYGTHTSLDRTTVGRSSCRRA